MICPSCGKDGGVDSPFCTYCGANLSFVGHRLDDEKRRLKDAVAKRERTDWVITPWIVLIPLIVNLTLMVAVLAAAFSLIFSYDIANGEMPTQEELIEQLEWVLVLAVAGNVIFFGIFAGLTYLLLDGANRHIDAEKTVREAAWALVSRVQGANPAAEAQSPWRTYDPTLNSEGRGNRRNPLLWSMVLLLPLVGSALQLNDMLSGDYEPYGAMYLVSVLLLMLHAVLVFYLLHMITTDNSRHDADWVDFAVDTRVALAKAGVAAGGLNVGSYIQARPTAIYIVVSFITGGLFMFYWWFVIVKDGNAHYVKQARFEEELLRMVSTTS